VLQKTKVMEKSTVECMRIPDGYSVKYKRAMAQRRAHKWGLQKHTNLTVQVTSTRGVQYFVSWAIALDDR